MDDDPVDAIAGVVARADLGDPAAKKALFAALYDELHRLAQAHLHRTGGPITLSATTLLHEAYLDIARRDALAFPIATGSLATPPERCAGSSSTTSGNGPPASVAASSHSLVARQRRFARTVGRSRAPGQRADRSGLARSGARGAGRSEVLLRVLLLGDCRHAERVRSHRPARLGKGARTVAPIAAG